MLVKFFNGLGRHTGVGEIHHDLVPGQFGGHSAADDIKGPDIRRRNDAPHIDSRRLFKGVDPNEHPDARIPVRGVRVVRAGPVSVLPVRHAASELPRGP